MVKKGKFSLMTFALDLDVVMRKMSTEECLLLAQNEGITYVDVMNAFGHRLQAYIDAEIATEVRTLCYIGTISFFSNSEERIKKELSRHLQSAKALNASLFMIVPTNVQKDEKVCAKLGKEKIRTRLKRYFELAIDMAAGTGITVCFETTPHDYTCLSGTEDCRWILEQVPKLKLVYDTANMLPHGDDPLEYYESLKKYIIHTHLKDVALKEASWKDRLLHSERTKDGSVMNCCLWGDGIVPLKEIVRRMERDGYEGTYAIEFCHPSQYPSDFAGNAKQLRRFMEYLR